MLNVKMAMSLEGFDQKDLEYFELYKYTVHNSGDEIQMINDFVSKNRMFCGHNAFEAFDYALRHFQEFCLDLFDVLREGSNDKLLELNPFNISTTVFTVEKGRRQYDIYDFTLSIDKTLDKIGDRLFILELLYDNLSNQIYCSTIDDLMHNSKRTSHERNEFQIMLDELLKYGYIDCDDDKNYSINNFGIYILRWK